MVEAPEMAATQEQPPVQEVPLAEEPVEDPKPEPKVIKRRLKTRDVKRFGRILGKTRELSIKRAQARGESEEDVQQVDMITLLLTDGIDVAEKELNLWFADICELSCTPEELEEYRQERARLAGNPEYTLSQWDKENALSEKIAEMDVDFYSNVLDELQEHGGLGDFLTGLTRLSQRMGFSQRGSSNSE